MRLAGVNTIFLIAMASCLLVGQNSIAASDIDLTVEVIKGKAFLNVWLVDGTSRVLAAIGTPEQTGPRELTISLREHKKGWPVNYGPYIGKISRNIDFRRYSNINEALSCIFEKGRWRSYNSLGEEIGSGNSADGLIWHVLEWWRVTVTEQVR